MSLLNLARKISFCLSERLAILLRCSAASILRQRQQSINAKGKLRIGVTGSTCGFDPYSTGSYPVSSANFRVEPTGSAQLWPSSSSLGLAVVIRKTWARIPLATPPTSTPGHGGQTDSKSAGQRSIRWVCAIVPSSSGLRHSVVSGEIAGSNPVGTVIWNSGSWGQTLC